MLDRFRETLGIEDEEKVEEKANKIGEFNLERIISDFEEFLQMEGVDIATTEAELVSEFEQAVEIFEEIQPDLSHVQEHIANGEYISIIDNVTNDEFDQWVTNNGHVIDSLEKLKGKNKDVFDNINHVDESIEYDDFPDELDDYISKLTHLYAIFDVDSED